MRKVSCWANRELAAVTRIPFSTYDAMEFENWRSESVSCLREGKMNDRQSRSLNLYLLKLCICFYSSSSNNYDYFLLRLVRTCYCQLEDSRGRVIYHVFWKATHDITLLAYFYSVCGSKWFSDHRVERFLCRARFYEEASESVREDAFKLSASVRVWVHSEQWFNV